MVAYTAYQLAHILTFIHALPRAHFWLSKSVSRTATLSSTRPGFLPPVGRWPLGGAGSRKASRFAGGYLLPSGHLNLWRLGVRCQVGNHRSNLEGHLLRGIDERYGLPGCEGDRSIPGIDLHA